MKHQPVTGIAARNAETQGDTCTAYATLARTLRTGECCDVLLGVIAGDMNSTTKAALEQMWKPLEVYKLLEASQIPSV